MAILPVENIAVSPLLHGTTTIRAKPFTALGRLRYSPYPNKGGWMASRLNCRSFRKMILFRKQNMLFAVAILAVGLFGRPAVGRAQTDEIQVYDAAIADQGKFNLMMHSNFTPKGR